MVPSSCSSSPFEAILSVPLPIPLTTRTHLFTPLRLHLMKKILFNMHKGNKLHVTDRMEHNKIRDLGGRVSAITKQQNDIKRKIKIKDTNKNRRK